MNNGIDCPSEKKIRDERTPFFKRVFSGWKSTIARLFLFAFCASAIIALAFSSQNKSPDKRPTERSVASRSLPVNAANIVAVDEIVASAEPLSEETTESVEVIVDETPSNEEAETLISEVLADIQPDEQQEIAFSDDVSEETDVVETAPDENANEVAEVARCASEASVELRPIKISEIRIGDRVPGVNPEGRDGSDESLLVSEDLYVFTFRVPKSNGTFCNAKILRSASWLFGQQARFVSVVDGHEFSEIDALLSERSPEYFDLNFQLEVWLELSELGCVGWSKVVDVDRSLKYTPGEGNLVTGTFEHVAQETINLQIEGQKEPIGCTPSHPFWSVDREEFVDAGELFEGERVRALNGDVKRVLQKLPRPGPEVVYNLEVLGEHVYHVTSDGILVHNKGCAVEEILLETHETFTVVQRGNVTLFVSNDKNIAPVAVGTYRELRNLKRIKVLFGNDMHHIIRQKILKLLKMDPKEGTAVSLPHFLHKLTRTYGNKNKVPRGTKVNPLEELSKDIDDLKDILKGYFDDDFITRVADEIKKRNISDGIEKWSNVLF